MQQMRMECDEMTAPTPEGIIMWHAAIEAAAGLFHDEQMTIWSSEIMADMALDAGVQPADYDGVVDCYRAIRETLTEIGNAIRALPTPGDLRAALAAMVKPLVWEDVPEICTRQKASALGGHYSVVEFDAGTDDAHYATNFDLGGLLSFVFILEPDPLGGRRPKRFPTPEAARAAAETDYRGRVVAAIMGDEG
jgi:hypothetical protein